MTAARPYSSQEDKFITDSFFAGKTNAWIGEHIGRKHNAVSARLRILGLIGKSRNIARDREDFQPGEIDEPEHVISCNQDRWDVAWAAHHGALRYSDAKVRASVGFKEVFTSHIGDATLGGVATGML